MTTPTPCRSLYVHVPFCRHRCAYCDFYSELLDPQAAAALLGTMRSEFETLMARYDCRFATVFVGGGTPTVLPEAVLGGLLHTLASRLDRRAPVEFTVEANPATVTLALARQMADAGVNRLSLGAQSFHPAELRTLDRIHTPEQIGETVAVCRTAGITNINLDLMFGIPGQTAASWRTTLDAAIALDPQHLSCYGLTYEPGTRFAANRDTGRLVPLDEDLEAELYNATIDRLTAADFVHYEISNFARPGAECRHNLTYWHNAPCLGIGPAAAGYIDGERYRNLPDIAAYVAALAEDRLPRAECEQLDAEARARETAMLGLRLTAGLDRRAFRDRTGFDPFDLFAIAIERNVERGLLTHEDDRLYLTRAGLHFADAVIRDFL